MSIRKISESIEKIAFLGMWNKPSPPRIIGWNTRDAGGGLQYAIDPSIKLPGKYIHGKLDKRDDNFLAKNVESLGDQQKLVAILPDGRIGFRHKGKKYLSYPSKKNLS